eukprot:4732702-Pyramimonas_sp.AAC.1
MLLFTNPQGLQIDQLVILIHAPENSSRARAAPDSYFTPESLAPCAVHAPPVLILPAVQKSPGQIAPRSSESGRAPRG